MRCVLGLDIGTTSTIGVLIRPPDQTLALASRPVALRSDHVGWAEEDPEQWWANVGEIVRELMRSSGASPGGCRRRRRDRHAAGDGAARRLPGACCVRAFSRATRAAAPKSTSFGPRSTRRPSSPRPATESISNSSPPSSDGSSGMNPRCSPASARCSARTTTSTGASRLSARSSRTGRWKQGSSTSKTHAIDDALVALAHIPRAALPRKVASHEILGVVSDRGAAESGLEPGTPVIGGAADHIASALGAGVVGAGDVLLKFGGSVDILTATDHATPDSRLFLDYHLKPGLFVPNGCMSTGGSALNWFARQFASGEAEAAKKAGLTIHHRGNGGNRGK